VRVVTLGNLSPEKGLRVVESCAITAKRDDLPIAFRVLGSTTAPIAQSPEVPLTIHGSYDETRLMRLLAEEHADVLFFPAQVPETYSYTLSAALSTRLPIVASSLGALPERLADRDNARIVPWDAPPDVWNRALLEAGGMRLVDEHAESPTAEENVVADDQLSRDSSGADDEAAQLPSPASGLDDEAGQLPSPASVVRQRVTLSDAAS
jgi:hypothetical protein